MYVKRQELIIIIGPTASGKSELAVKLAKTLRQSSGRGGEIISADSRQVYRGLDIGSGKIQGKWHGRPTIISIRSYGNDSKFIYRGIPHYCIDFVSPKRTFTVAEYKKCAEQAIKDNASRGKIPILVGGTGFWIDAVVYDLDFPKVPPNQKLRRRLEKKSAAELLKILQKLDPERAKTIEQKNPRRLIRAIEIAKTLGRIPSIKKKAPYRALWIGIKTPEAELRNRIHKRLLQRMRAGMVREAIKLRRGGLSWKRFYELGLEYRFLADYLRKKITREEMIKQLKIAINEYARRQMVWFKRNPQIHWVAKTKGAEKLVEEFLKKEAGDYRRF